MYTQFFFHLFETAMLRILESRVWMPGNGTCSRRFLILHELYVKYKYML